jgi:hypothetical protein
LVAAGGARFALYGNVAALIGGCAGVIVLRPADPWHAVMVWTVSQLLVFPYSLWVNARALGVGVLRPLSGGFRLFRVTADVGLPRPKLGREKPS